jgi:hypothetical protein
MLPTSGLNVSALTLARYAARLLVERAADRLHRHARSQPASLQCAELLAGLARSQLSQARTSRLDQRGADSGLDVSAQLGPAQCFSLRCRGATFGVLPCASQSGSSRTREVDEMLMIGHSMRPTQ